MSVPLQWFTFPIPAGIDPFALTPDRIAEWFRAKGYAVTDGAAIDAVNRRITIGLDRDPSADAPSFANQPTQAEQQVAAAIAYLKNVYGPKYRAIPSAQRTDQDTAILSILVILKAQLTP